MQLFYTCFGGVIFVLMVLLMFLCALWFVSKVVRLLSMSNRYHEGVLSGAWATLLTVSVMPKVLVFVIDCVTKSIVFVDGLFRFPLLS